MAEGMKKTKSILEYLQGQKTLIFSVIALFSGALLIRLFYIWESSDNPIFFMPIFDSQAYHELAVRISMGGGYFTKPFGMAPGYIYFLGALYSVFGPHVIAAKIVQGVMGAVNTVLLYILGRAVFDNRIGLTAGLVSIFYMPMVFYEVESFSTVLEIYLFLFIIAIFIYFEKRRKFWVLGVAGLLFGLLSITRPNFILCLPIIAVYLVWAGIQEKSLKRSIYYIVIFTGALLICIVPVTIRNYRYSERFIPLTTNGGINFYIGNNPDYGRTMVIRPGRGWDALLLKAEQAGYISAPEQSDYFYRQAFQYIFNQPFSFLLGLLKKGYHFISGVEIPRTFDIYSFRDYSVLLTIGVWKINGFGFPTGIIIPFGILGIFLFLCERKSYWFIPAITLIYAFSIILFFPCSRYRIVVMPIFILFGVFFVFQFFGNFKVLSYRTKIVFFVCVILLLGIVNWSRSLPTDGINFKAEMYRVLGWRYLLEKNYEKAESHYLKAIKLDDNSPETLYGLGLIDFYTGEIRKAESLWKELTRESPDFAEGWLGLGSLALMWNENEEAKDYFQKASELAPAVDAIHFNLGISFIRLGDYKSAIHALKRTMEINSDYPGAQTLLGILYGREGDFSEAAAYLETGLGKNPNDLWALIPLSALLAAADDETLQDLARAERLAIDANARTNYQFSPALEAMSFVYAEQGDFEKAIEYGEGALRYAPENQKDRIRRYIEYFRNERQIEDDELRLYFKDSLEAVKQVPSEGF